MARGQSREAHGPAGPESVRPQDGGGRGVLDEELSRWRARVFELTRASFEYREAMREATRDLRQAEGALQALTQLKARQEDINSA